MPSRLIYLLSPKHLSPETIAVTFAKTSRSPESFQEIAAELSDEKSARFHEKWVVGYGHASVAEHAVLHIAIENVSRLAVECIESNRLASYTEKSTRYQRWGPDDYFVQLTLPSIEETVPASVQKLGPEGFFIPSELDEHKSNLKDYIDTCNLLFDTYRRSLNSVRNLVERQTPRLQNESDGAYDIRIRSRYVDSCRFLLPAASLANLGMTANARVLEHAISKMLSHPLVEVRQIGEQIKQVAQVEVPTLVKYAETLPYLTETSKAFDQGWHQKHGEESEKKVMDSPTSRASPNWCQLIDFDPNGENKILAMTLCRFNGLAYSEALEIVTSASIRQRGNFVKKLLGQLGLHDAPLRELEHTFYTFELVLDQGAYAEFKRHRMMTQTPQTLTTHLGYTIPRQVVEAGFKVPYCHALEQATEIYEKLMRWNPHVASYIVPNGFNRRVLFTINLREAFAFCQLRAAENAHFSMRRVAQRVAAEIRRVHPLLAKYMILPDETWQEIESQHFTQV